MSKDKAWEAAKLHPKASDLFVVGDKVSLSETDSLGIVTELGYYVVKVLWLSGQEEWVGCEWLTKEVTA